MAVQVSDKKMTVQFHLIETHAAENIYLDTSTDIIAIPDCTGKVRKASVNSILKNSKL